MERLNEMRLKQQTQSGHRMHEENKRFRRITSREWCECSVYEGSWSSPSEDGGDSNLNGRPDCQRAGITPTSLSAF